MTLARPRTVILTFWSANVMPAGASLRRMFAVGTVNSFVTRPLSVTVIFTVWLSARLVTPLGSSGVTSNVSVPVICARSIVRMVSSSAMASRTAVLPVTRRVDGSIVTSASSDVAPPPEISVALSLISLYCRMGIVTRTESAELVTYWLSDSSLPSLSSRTTGQSVSISASASVTSTRTTARAILLTSSAGPRTEMDCVPRVRLDLSII